MIFFSLSLLMLIVIYLAPALAIFPRLIVDPAKAFAIPLVSALIITLSSRVAHAFGLLSQELVVAVSVVCLLLATWRVLTIRRELAVSWSRLHLMVYGFVICALLPVVIKQAHAGFDTNDEIYSWNLWAIQYFFNEPVDFFYTKAPYPQAFPYLIAWCYSLLGNIDLQLPVKAVLPIMSAGAVCALLMAGSNSAQQLTLRVLLAIFLLYLVDLEAIFETGLAEVLMVPTLIVSVALFHSFQNKQRSDVLLICALCALLAGTAKQPALIWLMLALPALTLWLIFKENIPLSSVWPVALAWIGGLIWLLTEGSGFHANAGVVHASQANRDLLPQLGYAIQKHLIEEPLTMLLMLSATVAVLRRQQGLGVFYLLFLPSLLAWFIWGAYNTRLGAHVIFLAALLLALNDFGLKSLDHKILEPTYWLSGLSLLGLCYAVLLVPRLQSKIEHFSYYDAPKNVIYKYFGNDSQVVMDKVFRQEKVVWVPSNYVYGIFFKHNPLLRPDYTHGYAAPRLRSELLYGQADIVVDDGKLSEFSPGGRF